MALDTLPTSFKMAYATPTGSIDYRVLTANFGDGYNQRVPDGINNAAETWQVRSISLTANEKTTVVSFFDGKYGSTAFLWAPPGSSEKKWVCKSRTLTPSEIKDEYIITATFERVYDL